MVLLHSDNLYCAMIFSDFAWLLVISGSFWYFIVQWLNMCQLVLLNLKPYFQKVWKRYFCSYRY